MVAALATISASAIGSAPVARAQDEPPAAETATPDAAVQPNQADAGEIWTPGAGATFDVLLNPTVSVRVDAPYALAASGLYQLFDPDTGFGPETSVPATLSSFNRRAEMSVTINPGIVKPGSRILFRISSQDGTVTTTSPLYNLARGTRAYLPIAIVGTGVSTIPTVITSTGANACDAVNNGRGGPLGAFVNYTVQNTSTDSWFFIINPVPNATIVVSLTNYTAVAGQLQIYLEQAGCAAPAQLLGYGTNPNPSVTLYGVPAARLFFRVVSSAGQPAPPPYNISWAYATSTSGSFEPNNNPCQATPTQPGIQYTTLSDDQYDFFAMNITGTAQIQVLVQGHTIGSTQVQVRTPLKAGFTCPGNGADPVASTDRIDPFGVVPAGGGDVLLTVNIPGPGLYYIRVSLPSATGNSQPYRISWNYRGAGGGTVPDTRDPLFTSNPNQPFNPPYNGDILFNINAGQTATYYWSGMQALGVYDSIQVRIIGVTNLVGCGLGDPTRTNPNTFANNWASVGTTAPRGSISIQFNAAGGYNIEFRVLQSGTQRFFDAKPLKVSCGTLMTAREYLSAMEHPKLSVPEDKLDEPLQPPDLVLPEVLPTSEQPDVEPHP
ncbi:MAG: hypothetical protein RMN52_04375 [Anaerolineae bacterium]|nr:hypothetical protein [Candidatus Roseilinea sp.]MDW8449219.1 hypothetical protein [Anaerolineae bacterium]